MNEPEMIHMSLVEPVPAICTSLAEQGSLKRKSALKVG
jgi:hypothetical protein